MTENYTPTTERGRIRISGFDPERVTEREQLSEWERASTSTSETRWKRAFRRFRRNQTAMIGVAVVAFMAVLAFFSRPVTIANIPIQPISLAPYDPEKILYLDPSFDSGLWSMFLEPASDVGRYNAPSVTNPMGTGSSGRDLFSRILVGGRYSISIGFVVVSLTATFGLIYGSVSGYYGGWVDEIMMRIVDTIYAFPGLVLALVIVAMLGGGYVQLVMAFSLFGWVGYARLIRGEILKVKQNEYVMAARALGARDRSVIFRHVVPNAVTPLIVQASLAIGTVVIGVAALGYLGLGFPPGTPEWGTMLNRTRETIIQGPGGAIPWWATVFPGGAIFIFVMSMNMIGDGINDALDAQETTTVQQGGG